MARTAGTVEKTDDEKFAIGLTYKAPDMETGETFSASTASVTPAGLTLDGAVVTDDAAKIAEQMVSGGTAGIKYVVTIKSTISSGHIYEDNIIVEVTA